MPVASQACFSTNWNSASRGSKCQSITSEVAKVTKVVHSANQRALRAPSPPPGSSRISSTPRSGRKVTTERIGQLMLFPQPIAYPKTGFHPRSASRTCFSGAWLVRPRKHEPGNESRRPDEHGERVVIKITGLQPHHIAGDVKHARRHAVRTKAVDQPAVPALPEQPADPQCGPHKDDVVELVEVPLVEQKAVQHVVLLREPMRDL